MLSVILLIGGLLSHALDARTVLKCHYIFEIESRESARLCHCIPAVLEAETHFMLLKDPFFSYIFLNRLFWLL